jgi:hypothetical protein
MHCIVAQQPPPPPQHPLYQAKFSWKHSKSPLESFSNYETMLEVIHQKWPDLKHKHLMVVKHKDWIFEVVDDESLQKLFNYLKSTSNVELFIDTKCIRFSDYLSKSDLVKELLNCRSFHRSKFYFDETISADKYQAETIVVREELLRRFKLLDLGQASEYCTHTMRELIPPILYGALSLVDIQNDNPLERVQLICEKQIIGNSGYGPVDYIMSYKSVYIVIGEAKENDLDGGLNQNVMQQWNFLESLADKILPNTLSGKKRKVEFDTELRNLKQLGTFGITSTGSSWIFSRLENASEGSVDSVIVHESDIYDLSLFHQEIDVEKRTVIDRQVEALLRIIVHMIRTQKTILSSNFSYLLSDDTQFRLKIADELEMRRGAEENQNQDAEFNENQDEVDDEY